MTLLMSDNAVKCMLDCARSRSRARRSNFPRWRRMVSLSVVLEGFCSSVKQVYSDKWEKHDYKTYYRVSLIYWLTVTIAQKRLFGFNTRLMSDNAVKCMLDWARSRSRARRSNFPRWRRMVSLSVVLEGFCSSV